MSAESVPHDIRDRNDVERLVTVFYERAFADAMLGPIFVDIARMDLVVHMPIICDFWETVLFRSGAYRRNALASHLALHMRAHLEWRHFERWLSIWTSTVSDMFAGEKAELAKLQAMRIAGSMHRRLQRNSSSEFVSIHRREKL